MHCNCSLEAKNERHLERLFIFLWIESLKVNSDMLERKEGVLYFLDTLFSFIFCSFLVHHAHVSLFPIVVGYVNHRWSSGIVQVHITGSAVGNLGVGKRNGIATLFYVNGSGVVVGVSSKGHHAAAELGSRTGLL